MSRRIAIVGAPSSAGAYAAGQEKAPAAFRRHGLGAALARAGRTVHDRGDVAEFRWRPDRVHPVAMNLDAVRTTALAVADHVADALAADDAVLVLGGDCTVELGTVAGTLRAPGSAGLVYIDFDVDLNTPSESDGALDWTGVAHLLDLDGVERSLSGLGPRRPLLAPDEIMFCAVENITPPEAHKLVALGIEPLSRADVKADAAGAARRAASWASGFDRVLVHVDVDVLSYVDFPIAENTRRCPGLTLAELGTLLAGVLALPQWRALTITEVNPDHAPDEAASFLQLNDMLAAVLA